MVWCTYNIGDTMVLMSPSVNISDISHLLINTNKDKQARRCYNKHCKTLTNRGHHTQVGSNNIRCIKSSSHAHLKHYHVAFRGLKVQTSHNKGNFKEGGWDFVLGTEVNDSFQQFLELNKRREDTSLNCLHKLILVQ